jgi:hypothetical protein
VLLDLRVGLSLYVIPKRVLRELEVPRRLLATTVEFFQTIAPDATTRTSEFIKGWNLPDVRSSQGMMVIWRVLEQSCRKRTSSGKGVISCCGDANQQQRVFKELTGVLTGTEDCARVLSMEK